MPQFGVFSLNSLGVNYLALIYTSGQTALWGNLDQPGHSFQKPLLSLLPPPGRLSPWPLPQRTCIKPFLFPTVSLQPRCPLSPPPLSCSCCLSAFSSPSKSPGSHTDSQKVRRDEAFFQILPPALLPHPPQLPASQDPQSQTLPSTELIPIG